MVDEVVLRLRSREPYVLLVVVFLVWLEAVGFATDDVVVVVLGPVPLDDGDGEVPGRRPGPLLVVQR